MIPETSTQSFLGVVVAKPAGVRPQKRKRERHVGTVVLVEGQRAVQIKLTRGLVALVDYEDAAKVLPYKWRPMKSDGSRITYARCNDIKGTMTNLHHFVFPVPEGFRIDHKNHDGLDCRKSNLRQATLSQNAYNARKSEASYGYSSRFKGVCRPKGYRRWIATIVHNYKQLRLGSFESESEAAAAYNKKALELAGEYAALNNILPVEGIARYREVCELN